MSCPPKMELTALLQTVERGPPPLSAFGFDIRLFGPQAAAFRSPILNPGYVHVTSDSGGD